MPTPHRPELNALFNKPPADAIEYLQSKGYKIGWDWHQTLDDAHSRAFTVAKVAKLDVLQDIRKSLITALEKGQSFEKWQAEITPILQEKGWWGKKTVINPAGQEQEVQLGSPRRLRTIYHTNMRSAFSAGRYKTMLEATETRPFWEYRHITMVNYREEHKAWNGRILRAGDPFWTVAYPPSKFGCNCRVIAKSASEVEGKEILSSEGYQTQYSEKIGVDSFTGADVYGTRQRFDIPTQDGTTLTFSPAAGFNNSPATSYAMDQVLANRATKYLGNEQGLKQVQQIITAPVRQKAHHAFIDNTLSFGKAQGKTSTVGVLQAEDIVFLQNKWQSIESPIVTIADRLLIGKKAKRHETAGDALSTAEWQELPLLIAQVKTVLYDVNNDSVLYVLRGMDSEEQKVIKLSLRAQNGVIEIVSIFKVKQSDISAGVKSGQYEVIRE